MFSWNKYLVSWPRIPYREHCWPCCVQAHGKGRSWAPACWLWTLLYRPPIRWSGWDRAWSWSCPGALLLGENPPTRPPAAAWYVNVSQIEFQSKWYYQGLLFSSSVLSNSLWPRGLPGIPVLHHLLELAQTHIHPTISSSVTPPPSTPAFNVSQHQGLF